MIKPWPYASHTIVMNNMAQDAQNGIKAFLKQSNTGVGKTAES